MEGFYDIILEIIILSFIFICFITLSIISSYDIIISFDLFITSLPFISYLLPIFVIHYVITIFVDAFAIFIAFFLVIITFVVVNALHNHLLFWFFQNSKRNYVDHLSLIIFIIDTFLTFLKIYYLVWH